MEVSPLKPLIWAQPVSPGGTWCLIIYLGITSLNCSTNCGLSGLGPTRLISPLNILNSWGSSSMLVLLMNLPTVVTLGSLLVVQAFSSSSSVCRVIDLNLYI